MRKITILLLLATPLFLRAQSLKTLKKTLELNMPKTIQDSMPGTRGAAVVWHPVQKKYYAAFAGNMAYPMAVFDAAGKRLSGDELSTMADLRGLWYNTKQKKISGNGFNETGWISYNLNAKGIPESHRVDIEGMNQPETQSIGTYNAKSNRVYFLQGQHIRVYGENGTEEADSTIRLFPGIRKDDDKQKNDDGSIINEDYSYNVLLYTGIPKAEFGLLNVIEKQVELYNRKTGLLTQVLKLPSDISLWEGFNFSYTNGTYWAFDQKTRIWTGYK